MTRPVAPPRPGAFEERLAAFFFRTFGPRLPRREIPMPPAELAPSERLRLRRHHGPGHLEATWYPASSVRGAVLLAPPFTPWGQAYFHRHGRVEALRAAGYHVLSFDFGSFQGRAPANGLDDLDVEDALLALRERVGDLPLHVWGVSAGGYWAHPVLSRSPGLVTGAFFEDVCFHLIEWSKRHAPLGRPAYLIFQTFYRRAYRFLDLRRQAPALQVCAVGYAGGARDRGARPEETMELARLAGAEHRIVDGAGHLETIKRGQGEVVDLALATFERALS